MLFRSAKRKIPGARYSLDELCKRFGVDLSARSKHGALLDAGLTAQVYLELIGGRQRGLALAPSQVVETATAAPSETARVRPRALPPLLSEAEAAAQGVNAIGNSPDEVARVIRADMEKGAKLLKSGGTKTD